MPSSTQFHRASAPLGSTAGSSEDGRRISLQIPAQDLEEIPLPPEELSLAGPFRGFRP